MCSHRQKTWSRSARTDMVSSTASTDTDRPLYRETQRFRQPWLMAVVGFLTALSWYAAISQLIFHDPFGKNPAPDAVMVGIVLAVGIGLPLLMYTARLTTQVRFDGLYVRYFPFHRSFRKLGVDRLADWQVVTYRSLRHYGGWGIRRGRRGKAYNVRGDRGVELTFPDGKRLLIGSQAPGELADAIATVRRSPPSA